MNPAINVSFEDKNLSVLELELVPDQSLLEIVLSQGIELHHNCGGVCACSTCHIYITEGDDFLAPLSDREEDFIDRAVNPKINSRLACQCIVQKNASNVAILIPDQSQFLGE